MIYYCTQLGYNKIYILYEHYFMGTSGGVTVSKLD